MGDIGMDKWWWRMEEHRRKGHHIIRYPERVNVIEQDLFLKQQRVNFWEKHHRIPTTNDLNWWEREVKT